MEHFENKNQTLEQLLKGLQSEDREKRAEAADDLGELGEQAAVEPLIRLLHNDKEYYVRVRAANALGKIGGEQAIDALIVALRDYAVLSTAAKALANFKAERAIRPIIEIFENAGTGHHYGLAAQSLATFGEPAFLPLLEALEKPKGAGLVASALGAMGDKRAIEPLIKMVRDRDIDGMERRIGVSELGELGGAEVFEFLKQVINDPTEEAGVRSWAAESLGKSGEASFPILFEAFKDDKLRYGAAGGFALAGDVAIGPLTEALDNPNSKIREGAATALGLVADPTIVPNCTKNPLTVNLEPVEPLIRTLEDKDSEVRASAVRGIWNIVFMLNRKFEMLRDTPNMPTEMAVIIRQQPHLDREQLIEPIVKVLKDESSKVRADAAMVLGQLGVKDDRVVVPLQAALEDQDEYVRFRANEALITLGVVGI